jgi:hypothetical protein
LRSEKSACTKFDLLHLNGSSPDVDMKVSLEIEKPGANPDLSEIAIAQ